MAIQELTKEAAAKELTDGLTAKALNDPRETRPPTPWEQRVANNEPPTALDITAAYVTGLNDGSIAVAHRWLEGDRASALAYLGRREEAKMASD